MNKVALFAGVSPRILELFAGRFILHTRSFFMTCHSVFSIVKPAHYDQDGGG